MGRRYWRSATRRLWRGILVQSMLWESAANGDVHCLLCAHDCRIKAGGTGVCGVRANYRGKLISLVSDIITGLNMDPVEKKPLYHFLPGTRTFSVGGAGCNFRCFFCQNSDIAHVNKDSVLPGRRLTPETIARLASQNRAPSVAFTYNEPTLFFEQSYAAAGLAKGHGLKTILVSNGFMSEAYLQSMRKRIDAANIDLKSFSDDFYRKFCRGRLQPVLDNLKRIREAGWWLEVTTLLIPGVNDSEEEVGQCARFICNELGREVPWHITAFHGACHMENHPSTPLFKLEEAWNIGQSEGLAHVYIGNAQSMIGSNTVCPDCGTILVERRGWQVRSNISDGKCPSCQREIAGVWN